MSEDKLPIAYRFRGYLPVVMDLETGGFNKDTDAVLECAAVLTEMTESGQLKPAARFFFNVDPFPGANIEASSLAFTGIDPTNPLRGAIDEKSAFSEIFRAIRTEIKRTGCHRAILVAHNAHFDHGFINAAAERCNLKRNPFHPFSSFDTATLSGLAYGQTVLARSCEAAGISFDANEAHSAEYDCDKTAELFCGIVNRWQSMENRYLKPQE